MHMRNFKFFLIFATLFSLATGCSPVWGEIECSKGSSQSGVASWYGGKFHGRKTASGARFNKEAMTAAHKTLPFGTIVRVTHLKSRRSIVVKITDRGPYIRGRIIDLSQGAARKLGMIRSGLAKVRVTVLRQGRKCKS